MTETRQCPECGAELAADAPSGLCPACLLKRGFESRSAENLAETAARASRFTAPTPEELARRFPQLEMLELLGQGGMGAVYKARQPSLDRLVAVKILPIEAGRDPDFAERFTREARALARLSHPNIVGIYDFGQADGLYYFVMEYVDGVSLRQLVEKRSLDPQQALALVPQICEALQFAHDEGIVHRDVKPENILLDKRGRVKIADFGLAKLLGRTAGEATLTRVEQVMGTPLYMAPEQMQGSHAVDHRADIYSLGVVFYEMLTGELPLGRFAPPSQKVHIDVRLDEVVLRTLEREPDRRYQHASEVKTEVESIVSKSAAMPMPAAIAPLTDCPAQVRAPAIGLFITAIANWIIVPLAAAPLVYLYAVVNSRADPSKSQWSSIQLDPRLMVVVAVSILLLSACMMAGALKMIRCQAYGLCVVASVLAMVVSPGNIIGLPIGVWALVVLTQPEVRRAFRGGGNGKSADRHVEAPADCVVLCAAVSLFTAFGIAAWLGPRAYFGDQPWRGPLEPLARNNLVGMSIGLALHGLVLGSAGLAMRRLRARMPVLLAVVLAGVFFPLVVALNVILEMRHIPQWPAVIPVWLGMPAALWTVVVLFRADVREAFTQRAASPSKRSPYSLDATQKEAAGDGPQRSFPTFQLLAVGGFALMLVSGLFFVAGSPTINVMPRNSANFFGIAVACAGMLAWIIAAAIGQRTEESEAESVAAKQAQAAAEHSGAPVEDRQEPSVRRVRLASLGLLIAAATAWLATIGEIVFLISQQYINQEIPEYQLGLAACFTVLAYAFVVLAAMQGRWLTSRRMAIAGSLLLVAMSCTHLVLFAREPHRGQLSPHPQEWFDLWSRLRVAAAADTLAIVLGCVSLGFLSRRETSELFRVAAMPTTNWRRLVKATVAIGVAAAASWIAVAVSMDLRRPPPPAYPDESRVVVFHEDAPTVSPYGIELLQLAPWQVAAMNEVLRGYYRHYLELEQKYTKRHVVLENRQVRATIYPFAVDRKQLVDGFWQQLDAFLSDSQTHDNRLATRNHRWDFYQTLEMSLFPFGAHRFNVDIRYDGTSFRCQNETDSGSFASEPYRELPIAYERLWKGPVLPHSREVSYYLNGHGDAACALVATPDGKHLVSAGTDGRIIIRGLDRLDRIATDFRSLTPRQDRKYVCLAASQRSDFVLAGGTEGFLVKVWLDDGRAEPLPLDLKGTITNLFLADDDATLLCVENVETIHYIDLHENRVRFTAPVFLGGVPPAKESQSMWSSFAFALSPGTPRLAVATQVRRSNEGPADSRFSVVDATGTTVLFEDALAAAGQDFSLFVRQPVALPTFADERTLRLYLPGSLHTWSYSNENKVWLDEGSRVFPRLSVRNWTGPLIAERQTLWARYGDLLMKFNADSGEAEEALLIDKREWTIAGGPGNNGKSLISIAAVVPIPQTNQVAVGLWDGRVAVATLRQGQH